MTVSQFRIFEFENRHLTQVGKSPDSQSPKVKKKTKMQIVTFLLLVVPVVNAMTVWPKPKSQVNVPDELFMLDATNFRFETQSESQILKNAFKRYRGIIFNHSPAFPGAEGKGDVKGGSNIPDKNWRYAPPKSAKEKILKSVCSR